MKPALFAEHIRKTFHRPGASPIQALRDASISVVAGERVAVLGRSGSGKSTLLNILGGLDKPDRGCGARVEICGEDILECSEKARARIRASRIGFVFQSFHLLPELTVLENTMLPAMALANCGAARSAESRAVTLLEKAGLGDRLKHRPSELSGGEQQRVAVARALLNGPELLLADEPTGNLDGQTGMQILELVFGLSGALPDVAAPALVMVTHSTEVASRCDRTLRLDSGVLQ